MTSLDIDPDDLFRDLFDDSGAPVPLPEGEQAVTERVAYSELELRLSAIAEEIGQ